MSYRVICYAHRPETDSFLKIDLPQDIVELVHQMDDIEPAIVWVREEFGGQFFAEKFETQQVNV